MQEEQVLEILRNVIDPELGINIVDLGLVYSTEVSNDLVHVVMTMTTPACPMHSYLTERVKTALQEELEGSHNPNIAVQVDLVWDPPWAPEMMSRAAKRQLGWE